jgi:hypothetical protein
MSKAKLTPKSRGDGELVSMYEKMQQRQGFAITLEIKIPSDYLNAHPAVMIRAFPGSCDFLP